MDVKNSGNPNAVERKIEITSPMLDEIMYLINAFIFAYMDHPYSIALIIVEKSSFNNTKSAAALATSVEFAPMEIPTDDCLSAAASLTPSPIIATISSNWFSI